LPTEEALRERIEAVPDHGALDDVVVGAGILGLAHAYHLAQRGRQVMVFERNSRAIGASVRNFGMLWPIGQPFGPLRALAMRSVDIWLEVLASCGSWHERTGSLHLAYRDDEAQVLEEFAEECLARGEQVALLNPAQVHGRAPCVRRDGLQGALWSEQEVCVDPREVIAALPGWLARDLGVAFQFDTPVTAIEPNTVATTSGTYSAGRIWVCSGDELALLFPALLKNSGLVRCKLQMMRSQAYRDDWRIGPMLAAGLTLRHYAAFRVCPSLPRLVDRIAQESPWLDRYGIHVLVSQNGLGELVIGDSHEYDREIDPFDKAEIEEWILGYLSTFLRAPDLKIVARWHGTYARHRSEPYIVLKPRPGVAVITGVGGAGMTLSFGLAETIINTELDESTE
jgi:FAD dependent oxidoreductase TIGR03364